MDSQPDIFDSTLVQAQYDRLNHMLYYFIWRYIGSKFVSNPFQPRPNGIGKIQTALQITLAWARRTYNEFEQKEAYENTGCLYYATSDTWYIKKHACTSFVESLKT
jgi:hypothetical protein